MCSWSSLGRAMKRSPRVRLLFSVSAVSKGFMEERSEGDGLGDVHLREAILLCKNVLVVLDDGRRLVDHGDLGAQTAEGAAEAGSALRAQRGQVMAKGPLLLVAGAEGDGPNVGISLSRVAQGEGEGGGRLQ